MHDSEPAQPRVITSDFVKTHCATCAAGQTIARPDATRATYCLLLREWMTDDAGRGRITDCDRHEPKESAGA